MGMLVTGSIISPRIFISTSIVRVLPQFDYTTITRYALTHQRVGTGARDAHGQVRAGQVAPSGVRGA